MGSFGSMCGIWSLFLMLVLLVEYIFLSSFYGLYILRSRHSNLNNSISYFHWKIIARDLLGTKLICYQLSYPGSVHMKLNVFPENVLQWQFISSPFNQKTAKFNKITLAQTVLQKLACCKWFLSNIFFPLTVKCLAFYIQTKN